MDVKLPALGEGVDSGSVVGILVKEGDQIEQGQTIIELENEKAVAPIPSPAAGKVTRIRVKEGDKLSVGQPILTLEDGKAAPAPAEATARKTGAVEPAEKEERAGKAEPGEKEDQAEGATATDEEPAETEAGAAPVAPPSIRRLARDLGIDLRFVRGSERGGRIVMADLRAYIQRLQKAAARPGAVAPATAGVVPAEAVDFSKWGGICKEPMSQLRKVISRRMLESWTSIPRVTQFDEADVSALMGLRKKYSAAYEAKGARLTLSALVLKALVATLKKHEVFNASLDEAAGEIVLKEYYHIGVAVDTDAGLLVPVIRDVDKKGLIELAQELNALAERARDRKLSLEEMKGGTFTLSNQGGIGGAHFTPIVNKPEVAILGLGRSALKPVVRDGRIEPRLMLPLAVSYDHRVIDGAAAARFTMDLVQELERFSEEEVRI